MHTGILTLFSGLTMFRDVTFFCSGSFLIILYLVFFSSFLDRYELGSILYD